jgi:Ca2+-binding RTX toxin-like protein
MWGFENDSAYGGPGNDRFHESDAFTMRFYGDDGNDTVYSTRAGGVHDFFGGAGFDTIDYSAWDRMVHVSLDGDDDDGERGVANCEAWNPWTCSSWRDRQNVHSDFENVTGSPQNDWIEGNGLGNVLYGQGGNDVVEGFAGNDTVDAGSGPEQTNQRVDGGAGDDVCRGSGVSSWPGCER